MTQAMTKVRMVNAVDRIVKAEGITKKDMIEISRAGLLYVWESKDIQHINRLVTAFAGIRKKEVVAFFSHFLPHDVEKDKNGDFVRFGARHKGKKRTDAKWKDVTEFLSDPTNNIWNWSDANLELKEAIDTAARLDKALKTAIEGLPEKDGRPATPPMPSHEIMAHILSSGAVTLDDLIKGVETMSQVSADVESVMVQKEAA